MGTVTGTAAGPPTAVGSGGGSVVPVRRTLGICVVGRGIGCAPLVEVGSWCGVDDPVGVRGRGGSVGIRPGGGAEIIVGPPSLYADGLGAGSAAGGGGGAVGRVTRGRLCGPDGGVGSVVGPDVGALGALVPACPIAVGGRAGSVPGAPTGGACVFPDGRRIGSCTPVGGALRRRGGSGGKRRPHA